MVDDSSSSPLTAEDVVQAYQAFLRSKESYLETLARYIASQPDEGDAVFLGFSQDAETLRVLHAVSVGYGWTDEIYKVSGRAQVAQAQLRGLITRDELHGGIVLTQAGVEVLRHWTDCVVPLTERHPRYQELWRVVTGLEG